MHIQLAPPTNTHSYQFSYPLAPPINPHSYQCLHALAPPINTHSYQRLHALVPSMNTLSNFKYMLAPPTNTHSYQCSAGFIGEEECNNSCENLLTEPGEFPHQKRKLRDSTNADKNHEP